MGTKPNIYDFTDLHSYLKAFYNYKKNKNPRWSLGVWSKKLGLKGSGTISNFISGRRIPEAEILEKIKSDIELTEYETEYFEALVIKSSKNNNKILQKVALNYLIDKSSGQKYVELEDDVFRQISSPLALVLQSAVKMKDFRFDMEWIRQRLTLHETTAEKITEVFQNLIKVGILRQEADRIVESTPHYKTPADIESEALKSYYEESLELNRKAVRSIPREERHLNSITFCCDEKRLPELKEAIHQFSRKLLQEFDQEEGNVVYQLHTQLIPQLKVD